MVEIVDVVASSKILCGDERPPLGFATMKSGYGNSMWASGMSQIIKVLHGQAWGMQVPNVHLREMNPHIHMSSAEDTYFSTELMLFPMKTSVVGITAIGFGGTMGHLVCCNGTDPGRRIEARPGQPLEPLAFWPGGGGALALQPQNYHIIGSWTGWSLPELMENDGDGIFGYTVVIGANRFEDFQIWCDGDPGKVIHPGMANASSGCKVHGPDDDAGESHWRIDGRVFLCSTATANRDAIAPIGDPGEPERMEQASLSATSPTEIYESTVSVGDRYRAQLKVAGKWICVSWHRLPEHAETQDLALMGDPSIEGTYHVVGDFNAWLFQAMMRDESGLGLHRAEFKLLRDCARFQIVRNMDWSQVFHPDATGGGNVSGPDSVGHDSSWWIDGKVGDVVEVEFQRSLDDGRDRRRIAWRIVRHEALTAEESVSNSRGQYCIVGSWDRWSRAHAMQWDGSSFRHTLRIGSTGVERFQVLVDGDWDKRIFPSSPDANAHDDHALRWGSSLSAHGFNWAIGVHEAEQDCTGESFVVSLHLGLQHMHTQQGLSWKRVGGEERLAVGDVDIEE